MNKKMVVPLEKAIGIVCDIKEDNMRDIVKRMNDAAEVLVSAETTSVSDRIKTFFIQHVWRGSHGPLSSEMRNATNRYHRSSLFWSLRLHKWLPFMFRPRRFGFLPEQLPASDAKRLSLDGTPKPHA